MGCGESMPAQASGTPELAKNPSVKRSTYEEDTRVKKACQQVQVLLKVLSGSLKSIDDLVAQINKEIEQLEQNYKEDPQDNESVLQFLKKMSDDVAEATKGLPGIKSDIKEIQAQCKQIESYKPPSGGPKVEIKSNMLTNMDDGDDNQTQTMTIGPKKSDSEIDPSDTEGTLEKLAEMQEKLKKITDQVGQLQNNLEGQKSSSGDLTQLQDLVKKLDEASQSVRKAIDEFEAELSSMLKLAKEISKADDSIYSEQEKSNVFDDRKKLLAAFKELNDTYYRIKEQQEQSKANMDAQLLNNGDTKKVLEDFQKLIEDNKAHNKQVDEFGEELKKTRQAQKDFKIVEIQKSMLSEIENDLKKDDLQPELKQSLEAMKNDISNMDTKNAETAQYKELTNLVSSQNEMQRQIEHAKSNQQITFGFTQLQVTVQKLRDESNNLEKLGAQFDKTTMYGNKFSEVRQIQTQMDLNLQKLEDKIHERVKSGIEHLTQEQLKELQDNDAELQESFQSNRKTFGGFGIPQNQKSIEESLAKLKSDDQLGKLLNKELGEGMEIMVQNIQNDIDNLELNFNKHQEAIQNADTTNYHDLIPLVELHDDQDKLIKNLLEQVTSLLNDEQGKALFTALQNVQLALENMEEISHLEKLVSDIGKTTSQFSFYEEDQVQIYKEKSDLLSAKHAELNVQVEELVKAFKQEKKQDEKDEDKKAFNVWQDNEKIEIIDEAQKQLEKDMKQAREEFADFKFNEIDEIVQGELSNLKEQIDKIEEFESIHEDLVERVDKLKVAFSSIEAQIQNADSQGPSKAPLEDLIAILSHQCIHAETLERLNLEGSDLIEEIPAYGKNDILDDQINRLQVLKRRVDQYEDFKAQFIATGTLNTEQPDIDMVMETERNLNRELKKTDESIDQVRDMVKNKSSDNDEFKKLQQAAEEQLKELESVINEEFKKAINKIKEIQDDNNSNSNDLNEFLTKKVEPECDEEHEFTEEEAIKTMLAELNKKLANTNEQLENSKELHLPDYTRVIEEQNRESVMLLELFSRAYTLYSEMTIQQLEGYYHQAEHEILNLLDEKSKGSFPKKAENQLNTMIENLDKFNPEDFSKKLNEVNWKSIHEYREDPAKQKLMLENLLGNSDSFDVNVKVLQDLTNTIMEFGKENKVEVKIVKKKLKKKKANTKDKVDDMFFHYAKNHYAQLEAKKIREGFYQLGTKKIHATEKNGKVLVRIGGGFATMESFFETLQVEEQAARVQNMHTQLLDVKGAKKGKKRKTRKSRMSGGNITNTSINLDFEESKDDTNPFNQSSAQDQDFDDTASMVSVMTTNQEGENVKVKRKKETFINLDL